MIVTLLVAFLSLIALMIVHEFGHFIIAKKFGVKVEEFGIGYPPKIFGKKFGETVYSINLIPLGAFVRIYGEEGGLDDYRSFSNLAIWKRMLIVLGGVMAFWLASIIIFSVVFGMGATVPVGDQEVQGFPDTTVRVVAVEKNSPASDAGLKDGDIILALKNQVTSIPVNKIADFQNFTKNNKGNLITVTVQRQQQTTNLTLTPRISYPSNQGPVGIVLERTATVIKQYPWYEAPVQGVMYTGRVTIESISGIYKVVANVFSGKGIPPEAQLAGPVGITIFLARAASYGPGFFLYFIGSLSVLIALFNIFPIPALDGGKLLFLIIEKIHGKPVSVKAEQNITIIFFVLLITMSIFVTVKFDLPRLSEFLKAGS